MAIFLPGRLQQRPFFPLFLSPSLQLLSLLLHFLSAIPLLLHTPTRLIHFLSRPTATESSKLCRPPFAPFPHLIQFSHLACEASQAPTVFPVLNLFALRSSLSKLPNLAEAPSTSSDSCFPLHHCVSALPAPSKKDLFSLFRVPCIPFAHPQNCDVFQHKSLLNV